MKPLLVGLLLLSLAGNAVLAVLALQPAAKPAVAASVAAAKPVAAIAASPVAAPPINWQTLKPDANLHTLVANLRAAGFPSATVRAVVSAMIRDRLDTGAINAMPFWKQNPNNPEYLAAQQLMSNQARDMANELLGPDAKPSAIMDPAARERRFGSLSDEKVDAVENITRDYNEMRSKLYAQRKAGDLQGSMGTQVAMDQELQKELGTVLSPSELEQYEMRSSQSASRVMANVKDVDVTEAEYTALFRAQKAYDVADPLRAGVVTMDAQIQRATAQEQLNEQARAVLTDDRFYEYLKGSDASYARTAQFTAKYPDITPATTYDLTKIERDYMNTIMSLNQGGPPTAERGMQMSSARKDYQEKLNTLLGPDVATAYAQRNRR